MKKTKKAVTLVELIVGISLSMLLMVSIGIFTSSGLSNLFLQEKSIGNIFSINKFIEETKNTLDNIDSESQILTNGIIFKRKTEYNEGGFAYIGTTEKDFCENGQKTKHIFIKNFIPFSENKIKTGNFESKTKQHRVFENGNLIIGTKFFGKDFENGSNSKEVPLNNPTGITTDSEGNLFISDTLNDRILMRKSNGEVYNILGNEILKEPNSLQFENGKLKIANAGKKEILEYSVSEKSYDINFDLNIENKIFKKIKVNLIKQISNLNNSKKERIQDSLNLKEDLKVFFSNNFNITQETFEKKYYINIEKEDFNSSYEIENIKLEEEKFIKNIDDFIKNECQDNCNTKKYDFLNEIRTSFELTPKYITDFYTYEEKSSVLNSISGEEVLDLDGEKIFKINDFFYKKEETESGINYKEIKLQINFKQTINSLKDKLDLGNLKGKYFIELEFIDDSGIVIKKENKKFFENDIVNFSITKTGNYPYDFGKDFDLNNPGNFINFDENYDKILDLPIKSLEISKNGDFINLILKYYRNFDCENIDVNEGKIRTLFLKKKIN